MGGGGEFKISTNIGAQFGEQTGDYIAAARHFGNKSSTFVKQISQELGFKYLSANSKAEFRQVAQELTTVDAQDKPILLECFIDFSDDSNALETIGRVNTTATANAVSFAKKVLPQNVKDAIRRR